MTKQESANEYTKYIDEHIANVKKAFNEYAPVLCSLLVMYDNGYTSKDDIHNDPSVYDEINQLYIQLSKQIQSHDLSKYSAEEFGLYRRKSYKADGEEKRSDYEFNKYINKIRMLACDIYIHRNMFENEKDYGVPMNRIKDTYTLIREPYI